VEHADSYRGDFLIDRLNILGVITLVYTALGAVYLNSSRDLKRLESVQRSPLYQQFGPVNTQGEPAVASPEVDVWPVVSIDAAMVVNHDGTIDAGAAGLSLTYAVTFTENVLWLVRLYSEVQHAGRASGC
jgi:hypothetical protein